MRARDTTAGFTLIELMIGLAIVALLLLLGLPSFSTFLRNAEIRSTAESIANGLRAARTEAVRENAQVAFTFLKGGTDPSWVIRRIDRDTMELKEPPIQEFTTAETGANAMAIRMPVAALSVVFDAMGRVASPTTLPASGLQQVEVMSRLESGGQRLRVNIDNAQGIRMCDPDPELALILPPDPRAC